jgi:indole-3-glycerol phosphate synthase
VIVPSAVPVVIKVCGVTDAADATLACAEGATVGEHLMRSGDPAQALERLVAS